MPVAAWQHIFLFSSQEEGSNASTQLSSFGRCNLPVPACRVLVIASNDTLLELQLEGFCIPQQTLYVQTHALLLWS